MLTRVLRFSTLNCISLNYNHLRLCSTISKSVADITKNTTQTKLHDPLPEKTLVSISNESNDVPLSGIPKEQLFNRIAKIYVPTRNTMQSGTANTHKWMIEFDTNERWENPLIGWASTADPMSNIAVTLSFDTEDEAVAYCEKNGWNYFIEKKREMKIKPKSYGVNFSWNKRTRTSTK